MIPENVVVPLNFCSESEYCESFVNIKMNGFWWYMFPSRIFGNYSSPYMLKSGEWVFNVKPGLAWAADFFKENRVVPVRDFLRCPLGLQMQVNNVHNSSIQFNMIENLKDFDDAVLDPSKPRAIRKALRHCSLKVIESKNENYIQEALDVWNSLVKRTGWKKQLDLKTFSNSWAELLSLPGTTIIACIENESDRVIGWLISKIINNTAYLDTIASHTDFLANRPNDLLVYSFIRSAQNISNVSNMHYSLVSSVKELERFKYSMGFRPVLVPIYSDINRIVSMTLKCFFKSKYNRMIGNQI